jgi:site-specific recombinase XerD
LDSIADLLPSWERHLRARNLAPRTIHSYLDAARRFDQWMTAQTSAPTPLDEIRHSDVTGFLESVLERTSPSYGATLHRRLQQLFRWLIDEDEITESPMRRLSAPRVPERPIPVIPDDDLHALLAACEGKTFEQRRDNAVIRVLLDCGLRSAELVGLTLGDCDMSYSVVIVVGKGARVRSVPFGAKTGAAIDRYLRARRHHEFAELDALWIGAKGALTTSGVTQLVKRRCQQAGIRPISLHRFRHTAAHHWLSAGGGEGDLELIMGWSSKGGMVRHYAKSAAAERAQDAHRRLGLADRF